GRSPAGSGCAFLRRSRTAEPADIGGGWLLSGRHPHDRVVSGIYLFGGICKKPQIGSGGRYGREHPGHFRDEDLGLLKALPDLEELSIYKCPITDRGMATIAGFAKLKSLTVSDAPITDAGVARVAELSGLRRLMLLNLPLTDASATHLSKLT